MSSSSVIKKYSYCWRKIMYSNRLTYEKSSLWPASCENKKATIKTILPKAKLFLTLTGMCWERIRMGKHLSFLACLWQTDQAMPSEEHRYHSVSAVPTNHSAPGTKGVAPQSWNILGLKHALTTSCVTTKIRKAKLVCVCHFQHCTYIYAGIGIYMAYTMKRELIEV